MFLSVISNYQILYMEFGTDFVGGGRGGMFRCVVVIAFQSLDCPIVRLHSYSLCADLFITYEQKTLCLALVVMFTCSFLVLFSASIACDVM